MGNGKYRNILTFEIFVILLFLLNISFFKISSYYLISILIIGLIFFLIRILKVGFEKRDYRYIKDMVLLVANCSILYMLIYYFSGLLFGFLKSSYGLSFAVIIKNIVPIVIVIICSEILRYIINNKTKDKIWLLIISAMIFIILDLNLNLYLYTFNSGKDYIYLFVNCMLPSIFKNALLTYISIKVGYKPNIIYRLILELPVFLVPVIPDIPTYTYILMNILFNWGLGMYMVKIFTKDKVESPRQKKLYVIPALIMSLFMILIIYLCSGYFTYSIIAVGSGSMEKEIYKGDAVIIKRVDPSSLEVGNIIVFKKENKMVVHRITKIDKQNESYYIKTKGDNNESVDNWTVINEEIVGVVKSKIKYIGYPTVWISELIK